MSIKLYISRHCGPCQQVHEAIRDGKFEGDIEVVDVETDEGFAQFSKEVLSKGDGAVPSAYRNGERCQILVNDETRDIKIACPEPSENTPIP